MLPGTIIYIYAGTELAKINSIDDLLDEWVDYGFGDNEVIH